MLVMRKQTTTLRSQKRFKTKTEQKAHMNIKRIALLTTIAYLLAVSPLMGQTSDVPAKDSLVWDNSILPVVFFLPETSFAFGASGILTFKKSSQPEEERPSQVLFAGIYTLRNQIETLSTFELYKDKRKHRIKGEVGYYKFAYNYFGIGADSRAEDHEEYKVNFPRFQISYSRKIFGILNVGLGYRFDKFNIKEIKDQGLLDRDRPIGWEGGVKSNYELNLFVDTRDNLNAPYRGFYGEIVYQGSLEWFFSDFDFKRVDIDLRYFTPIGKDWTLGHQLWLTHVTSGGPFYEFGHISTSSRSRGFDDRRFIDPRMLTYQSELRFPIISKIRGSAFYSYNLMPDRWSSLFGNREFFTYGIGLRYVLKKESRAGLRFDLARGDGELNFFATFNEAF